MTAVMFFNTFARVVPGQGQAEAAAANIVGLSTVTATRPTATVPIAATIAATSVVAATRPLAAVPTVAAIGAAATVTATRPLGTVPAAASIAATSVVAATRPLATVPLNPFPVLSTSNVIPTRPTATVPVAATIAATSVVTAIRPLGVVRIAATVAATSVATATRPLGTVPALASIAAAATVTATRPTATVPVAASGAAVSTVTATLTVTSAAVPWVPSDLTSLTSWYDPSSSADRTVVSSAVSALRNKQGTTARDLAQATAGNRPAFTTAGINGLDAMTFDGTADWMNHTAPNLFAAGACTVAVVAKAALQNDKHFLNESDLAGTNIYTPIYQPTSANGFPSAYMQVHGAAVNFPAYTDGTVAWLENTLDSHTCIAVDSGTNISHYVDGFQSSSKAYTRGSLTGINNFRIGVLTFVSGTFGYFSGLIGEIVCCNAVLSTDDRQKLEGYLAHKWGSADELDAGHPYKSAPPGTAGATQHAAASTAAAVSTVTATRPTATVPVLATVAALATVTATITETVPGVPEAGAATIAASSTVTATLTDVGGTPWAPSDLTALSQWYDPSDTAARTLVSSAFSALVNKQGATARDLAQATAGARPALGTINSLGAMSFDGTDDWIGHGAPALFAAGISTIAAVFRAAPQNDKHIIGETGSGTTNIWTALRTQFTNVNGAPDAYIQVDGGNVPYGGFSDGTVPFLESTLDNHIVVAVDSGSGFTHHVDGVSSSFHAFTRPPLTLNAFTIGALRFNGGLFAFFGGLIGEIVCCAGAITTNDRRKIEGYLAHKWGAADELAADHPYKAGPPLIGGTVAHAAAANIAAVSTVVASASMADEVGDDDVTTYIDHGNVTTTKTIDVTAAHYQMITLTSASCALTFTGTPAAGQVAICVLIIKKDNNATARAVTYANAPEWPNDTAPFMASTTANAECSVQVNTFSDGRRRGYPAGNHFP